MKLNQDIIRKLIKEEIPRHLSEIAVGEIKKNAIDQIAGILTQIENEKLNPEEIINQAKAQFRKSTQISQSLRGLNSERKLTEPEKEKREEIAKAMEEEDPDIDMSKKMAIATAQAKKSA
jgi:hypothetical protein